MKIAYICNRLNKCNNSPICGKMCKYTMNPDYAINKDAVELWKKFSEVFEICVKNNKSLLLEDDDMWDYVDIRQKGFVISDGNVIDDWGDEVDKHILESKYEREYIEEERK